MPMKSAYCLLFSLLFSTVVFSQSGSFDFRDRLNGKAISQNGYLDQPCEVILNNGTWASIFMTVHLRYQNLWATIAQELR